jgi:ABC-type transport system substrate-binding protein
MALFVVLAFAPGCAATPEPTGAGTATPTTSSAITQSQSPTPASELAIWTAQGSFAEGKGLGFGIGFAGPEDDQIQRLVKSGLFRLDADLRAQPDLASGPCVHSEDLLTLDCPLRPATFHDGTPFTADDVVFTMKLRRSNACRERDGSGGWVPSLCVGLPAHPVESVEAIDQHTVRFVLPRADPAFVTSELPWGAWMIESKGALEAAYSRLRTRLGSGSGDALRAEIDALASVDEDGGVGDCETLSAEIEALLAGVRDMLPTRAQFGEGGDFDPCAYLFGGLQFPLERLSFMVDADGVDAVAAAYPLLFNDMTPIGTGPYKIVSVTPGSEVRLEAFDAYHFGRPASDSVTVRLFEDEDPTVPLRAMAAGAGTIFRHPSAGTLRDETAVKVADPLEFAYLALIYNLRPGRLFADVELRLALRLCIDKPTIVDSATNGTGVPFDSPVPVTSWAYQPSIRPVVRDVDAATAMIEAAGWRRGADGVYSLNGRRLSAVVPVRADKPERVKFVDLLAFQAADCGIELEPKPVDFDEYFEMVGNYPHHVPGTDESFDLFFGGWVTGPDPDSDQWETSAISSEQNPRGNNFIGLSDPEIDDLLEQGRATYDEVARARIYRSLQERIVELQPYLSAWSARSYTALDKDLRSTAGELRLDSNYWWWQFETLTIAPP